MEVVDPFIHIGGHQHGHADHRVKAKAKARNRTVLDMRDFVDEAACTIKRQDRYDARCNLQPKRRGHHRGGKRDIADQRRRQKIRPVNTRVRRIQVACEFRRCTNHCHIVGRTAQLCSFRREAAFAGCIGHRIVLGKGHISHCSCFLKLWLVAR
jgi:hypothetical protein